MIFNYQQVLKTNLDHISKKFYMFIPYFFFITKKK